MWLARLVKNMQTHSTEGKTVIADLWLNTLPQWGMLSLICEKALQASNMNVVQRIDHQFEPQGTTAVWILAESHMAIHTYPEANFIAIDVFTCGTEGDPGGVIAEITERLDVRSLVVKEDNRGQRIHDLGA